MEALQGSDLILHAGDVGELSILEELSTIAPVHAVHGNTDGGEVRELLSHDVMVDLGSTDGRLLDDGPEGPVAYILHIREELSLDPGAADIDVVVTGHTHEPAIEEKDGILWLNPGSAGPKRFDLPVTVALLHIDGADWEAEIVEIVEE
jgi:hypothetical protein